MHARRLLPLLLAMFVGSGCAALVYEVVWFQLLQLVIGSSAVSLGVLLGTFMGGMCLGSLLFARVVAPVHHPLRVYALIEVGIGAIGLLVLAVLPLVGSAYAAWAGSGATGLILRAVAAGICLLPPTLLMGATLPALSRWVEMTGEGVSWLGFFYAGNIGGAVAGSLLAGFYLLRVFDMPAATGVAAAINAGVALLAWAASSRAARPPEATARSAAAPAPGARLIYVATFLSGLTALSAEVIWTRLLSLQFGATTYTFSLILAAVLLGLGLGSSAGAALARGQARPRVALAWCQALLVAGIAWAAYMLTDSLPYWPIDPSIARAPWFNFQIDLARCLWTVLPASLLWGASFPLALASVAAPGTDPARLVGGLYAANTVGAIVGSLGASLMAVAWIGSQHAQQLLVALVALSSLLSAWSARATPAATAPGGGAARAGSRTVPAARAGRIGWFGIAVAALGASASVAALVFIRPVPGLLVAYGRYSATRVGQAEFIYVGEGLNSSVAVSRLANGTLNYHNAGKVQASSEPQDMRLQRMLGHFTTLVPARPRSVLVIGCGAGVTAGAVSIDPRVERVTIAEIEPLVVETVSTYFSDYNAGVVASPKVRLRIDDARHFLQTTRETFDAITSDPLDPWVKGAAMLYTREFFEVARRHLNPGGVITLFVQLYWSSEAAVKSELATFFEAFPDGIVWANTENGAGYDLVLMGQAGPAVIDVDAMEERLNLPEYGPVRRSLIEIGFPSAVDLLATFAGQGRDLQGWLKEAAINRDRNLRLQYLAGLGVNLSQADGIYRSMIAWRKPPDSLFAASPGLKAWLWEKMQSRQAP